MNMKSNEVLNQIKTVLGIDLEKKEIKLESLKLENGTVVEAESFEEGNDIFIMTEDEKVALPVGEYMLEDSRLLVVEEEGKIADVREVSDEVPQEETEDLVEEDLAEEADVADWQGMEVRIKNLEDAIADLKADKMEASKVEEEVKEKLSAEPATKPIKHNPEGESRKQIKMHISPNRVMSTKDRIFQKISNIK
jgi:hypothetical protein